MCVTQSATKMDIIYNMFAVHAGEIFPLRVFLEIITVTCYENA